MKNRVKIYGAILVVLSILYPSQGTVAQNALIKIDIDRKVGNVDPNIYGAFIEPIKNLVYGSLYDPNSKFANGFGFRQDLIDLIKELKVSIVRWPGGNYVSGYNWEDGIGPKDKRPARMDLAWKVIDKNQMGTDEYVKFCDLIEAKNFVCINAGTGTLDQARYWVEYCNVDSGTFYSDLRRRYGHNDPYRIKYWALGNEPDGWWQMGHKNVEDYCKFAKEAAKLMHQTDKTIELIVAGASDYSPGCGWIEWNSYVLDHLAGYIDYISVHRYIKRKDGFGETNNNFSEFMTMGRDIDQKIGIVKSQINEALVKTGSLRPIYIAFDEFSCDGVNLTSALMMAQFFNAFIRNADIVKMANYSFLTRLVGDSPDGQYKNAPYHSFFLFSQYCLGSALDVYLDCETYNTRKIKNVTYLDVSAVYNERQDLIILNVVNRHETNAILATILLQTGTINGSITISEVNGDSIMSANTFKKQNVYIKEMEEEVKGDMIKYEFPSHSFTQIKIKIK